MKFFLFLITYVASNDKNNSLNIFYIVISLRLITKAKQNH